MRKIKWGVLGTAGICARTVPGILLAENAELYAIAGRKEEKVAAFNEKYGFEKTYTDYNELLADPEVEAVYIPLPNTLHYEWTIKALKCKKHVLCEKPLAPTKAQAEEMFAEAEKNGVILMEAFAYIHSPFTKALKEEIANGTIGDPVYMETAFLTSDYDLTNIRMRRETCGGSMYDLGVYCNTLIYSLYGELPSSVKASASFSDQKIDKLTNVLYEYADGKRAVFTCGMILATNKNQEITRFEIDGTKGSIRGKNWTFNGMGLLSYTITDLNGNSRDVVIDTPQNYALEVEQLGNCIINGEKPYVSCKFSLDSAEANDRVLESIGY